MSRTLPIVAALIALLAIPAGVRAETLVVRTVDPATGDPLAGAFVMVGTAPGQPFAGNFGTTDAAGAITFSDPALVSPAFVTAGTADRSYVTITESPADSVRIGLPPREITTGPAPPPARVTGTAPGIPVANNNGYAELGFVLPAVDIEVLLGTGQYPFATPMEIVDLPLIGPVEVPGIVVIPNQTELLFFSFGKPSYSIDLTGGTIQSLICPAGRVALGDLLSIGGDDIFAMLNAIQIQKFGIERDVPISDGLNLPIGVDLQANTPVTMQYGGVPANDEIILVSGAAIPGPGGQGERYVLFDGKSKLINAGSSLSAAAVPPIGDLSDATNAAIALHADSSSAQAWMSGVIHRGFVPPANLTANSFFLIPGIVQNDATISYTDPENPGVSPAPTWSTGVYNLTGDSGDPTVVTGIHWRVISPAGELGYTLPTLPPTAPPALPDPSATPGDDHLDLTLTVSNHTGDAQAVLESALGDASHFVYNTIEVEPPTTAIGPVASPISPYGRIGRAYPDPARATTLDAIHLPIVPAATGPLEVAIYDAGGRLVRLLGVPVATGGVETVVSWDGRDSRGQLVPAGTYFARLVGASAASEKVVIIH